MANMKFRFRANTIPSRNDPLDVLIIDDEFSDATAAGEALRALVSALDELEISAITAESYEDG